MEERESMVSIHPKVRSKGFGVALSLRRESSVNILGLLGFRSLWLGSLPRVSVSQASEWYRVRTTLKGWQGHGALLWLPRREKKHYVEAWSGGKGGKAGSARVEEYYVFKVRTWAGNKVWNSLRNHWDVFRFEVE